MVSAFSGCFCLLTVALDGPKGVRMAIEGPSSCPQKNAKIFGQGNPLSMSREYTSLLE